MTPAPKRRWLRWSLRTMFVLVTVVGCWLSYELNWIRQRRFVVARSVVSRKWNPKESVRAPGGLWIFGEPGYERIWVSFGPSNPRDNSDAEKAKAAEFAKLFPESTFVGTCIRTYTDFPGADGTPDCFPSLD